MKIVGDAVNRVDYKLDMKGFTASYYPLRGRLVIHTSSVGVLDGLATISAFIEFSGVNNGDVQFIISKLKNITVG